jgi:DNA-binding PadR family transcriptional regulator
MPKKPAPLRFQILREIAKQDTEVSGRDVRKTLVDMGFSCSGPVFYRSAGYLEDDGYVEGRTHEFEINGVPVSQRRYRVTSSGKSALATALATYEF